LKPNKLMAIKNGVILSSKDIVEPRVKITENTSPSYWENLANSKLVEELTGKKLQAHPQKTLGMGTGVDTKTTRNTNSTTAGTDTSTRVGEGSKVVDLMSMEEAQSLPLNLKISGQNIIFPSMESLGSNEALTKHINQFLNLTKNQNYCSNFKGILGIGDTPFWLSDDRFQNFVECKAPILIRNVMKAAGEMTTIKFNVKGFKPAMGRYGYDINSLRIIASTYSNRGRLDQVLMATPSDKYLTIPKMYEKEDKEHIDVYFTIIDMNNPGLIYRTMIRVSKHTFVHAEILLEATVRQHFQMVIQDVENNKGLFPNITPIVLERLAVAYEEYHANNGANKGISFFPSWQTQYGSRMQSDAKVDTVKEDDSKKKSSDGGSERKECVMWPNKEAVRPNQQSLDRDLTNASLGAMDKTKKTRLALEGMANHLREMIPRQTASVVFGCQEDEDLKKGLDLCNELVKQRIRLSQAIKRTIEFDQILFKNDLHRVQ
jgi:hypothetical protein